MKLEFLKILINLVINYNPWNVVLLSYNYHWILFFHLSKSSRLFTYTKRQNLITLTLDKNCQLCIINQWKVTDSSRMNIGLEVLRTCICVAISKSKSNGVFKIPQLPIINTRVRSSLCIIILRSLKRKSRSCNNKFHVTVNTLAFTIRPCIILVL